MSAYSPSSSSRGRRPSRSKPVRYAKQDPIDCAAAVLHPRCRATRHLLDARWSQVVGHGTVLADGLCWVPAPAETAASAAQTRRPQSRLFSWVARHSCGPDGERNPALFLVKLVLPLFLFLSRSLAFILASEFNALVPRSAYSTVSFSIPPRALIPSSVQLRSFPSNVDSIMANMPAVPCPRNPYIPLINPYHPLRTRIPV